MQLYHFPFIPARRTLRKYVAEVYARHLDWNINIYLLVWNLDVSSLSALAFDDADNLELVSPYADGLAYGMLCSQDFSGAEFGKHRHGGLFFLIG